MKDTSQSMIQSFTSVVSLENMSVKNMRHHWMQNVVFGEKRAMHSLCKARHISLMSPCVLNSSCCSFLFFFLMIWQTSISDILIYSFCLDRPRRKVLSRYVVFKNKGKEGRRENVVIYALINTLYLFIKYSPNPSVWPQSNLWMQTLQYYETSG